MTEFNQKKLQSLPKSLAFLVAVLLVPGCAGGSEEVFSSKTDALSVAVGDSCVLEDEFHTDFAGFSRQEVNLSTSGECSVGVCLAHHFQGRVSCPAGQEDGGQGCKTPDGSPVHVAVQPQLKDKSGEEGVFCSCRCDGKGDGPFCACPSGFACKEIIDDLRLAGSEDVAGSYCVHE